jgi:hypothetical protein
VLQYSRAVIGLNRRHSPERRHFSFWHEVGHYYLHRTRASGLHRTWSQGAFRFRPGARRQSLRGGRSDAQGLGHQAPSGGTHGPRARSALRSHASGDEPTPGAAGVRMGALVLDGVAPRRENTLGYAQILRLIEVFHASKPYLRLPRTVRR